MGGLRRRGRRARARALRPGAVDPHRFGDRGNCHAYWPLAEPLTQDEVERANRQLAYTLGADPASADVARILRIPGTLSHKHQPPAPVRALRLDVERSLDAADIVGGPSRSTGLMPGGGVAQRAPRG